MIPNGIRAQDGNPWHSSTEDVGRGRGIWPPDRGGAEEEHDRELREREERQREQHEREEREERGEK